MEEKPMADEGGELSDRALIPLHLVDVERLWGISRHTLLAEIRDGRLSCCIVRGRKYVTRGQLAAWLKRIEKPARES
jgi:hypothetical protein